MRSEVPLSRKLAEQARRSPFVRGGDGRPAEGAAGSSGESNRDEPAECPGCKVLGGNGGARHSDAIRSRGAVVGADIIPEKCPPVVRLHCREIVG